MSNPASGHAPRDDFDDSKEIKSDISKRMAKALLISQAILPNQYEELVKRVPVNLEELEEKTNQFEAQRLFQEAFDPNDVDLAFSDLLIEVFNAEELEALYILSKTPAGLSALVKIFEADIDIEQIIDEVMENTKNKLYEKFGIQDED